MITGKNEREGHGKKMSSMGEGNDIERGVDLSVWWSGR